MSHYEVNPTKKWTICQEIGRGHYGTVYKVKRKNKFYALKVQCEEELYNRELSFLRRLKYSNFVPKLIDHWIDNQYHFVIELLSERTRMSSSEVYIQLNNILSYLHNKKIVYFDLHHGNVLFKRDRVYLIDFALAHLFRNHEEAISNCYGTFTLKSGKEIDRLFLTYYWGSRRRSENAGKILDDILPD